VSVTVSGRADCVGASAIRSESESPQPWQGLTGWSTVSLAG
jgi:hypothetical protein